MSWYGEDRFGTIRHGGGTNGQLAMLVLVPARSFAVALLTNHSPGGLRVLDAMFHAAGIAAEEPEPTPLDGGRMRMESESLGGFHKKDLPPGLQPPPAEVLFYTPERWYVREGPLVGTHGQFIRDDDGGVRWLRSGGRLYRRI